MRIKLLPLAGLAMAAVEAMVVVEVPVAAMEQLSQQARLVWP